MHLEMITFLEMIKFNAPLAIRGIHLTFTFLIFELSSDFKDIDLFLPILSDRKFNVIIIKSIIVYAYNLINM